MNPFRLFLGMTLAAVAAHAAEYAVSPHGDDTAAGAWQPHKGNIFALKTARTFKQLFVDGKMMPESRWPNSPPEDLMTYSRAIAGKGRLYPVNSETVLVQ
jgi:hypothetical protein